MIWQPCSSTRSIQELCHRRDLRSSSERCWIIRCPKHARSSNRGYPYSQDPRAESGFIGSRESIGNFRDSLIMHLSGRGTYEASAAIERIIAVFPNFVWLKRYLQQARAVASRTTWIPPRVQYLIAL